MQAVRKGYRPFLTACEENFQKSGILIKMFLAKDVYSDTIDGTAQEKCHTLQLREGISI
jgi:hypothetical protein